MLFNNILECRECMYIEQKCYIVVSGVCEKNFVTCTFATVNN